MRKYFLIIWILFTVIIFPLKRDILFALPDIAHEDLTKMSTSIKRNLEESDANGLKNAIGGNEEKAIIIFDNKTSTANVSEDYPPNSIFGAQHYYDPTTGLGMWGVFPSAKTRANDLYKGALKTYCYSLPRGLVPPTWPWEVFSQSLHLVQEMVTPAHTITRDHALGDSFEKYVKDNWATWHEDTPEEGKIINPKTGRPYTGLKDYLENYKNEHPYNSSVYQLTDISKYMDELAKDSRNLPKDIIKINTDPTTGLAYPERIPLTWEQKRRIAEQQLPKALMYGAGLINTFWKDINSPAPGTICIRVPDPASPAGDHPDDRFDVSDEYYWESDY